MNTKNLLEKIKSKYIIESIISYLKNENLFYNIIIYSKLNQKILGIDLFNYKERYLLSRIKFEKHLLNISKLWFEDKIKEYESIFDYEEIKQIISKYFKSYAYQNKNKFSNFLDIKIYSPVLDIISKEDLETFIFFFDTYDAFDAKALDKLNLNSYSLKIFTEIKNIFEPLIKEKNILNKIKKIFLKFEFKDVEYDTYYLDSQYITITNPDDIYRKFFSLNINENNITALSFKNTPYIFDIKIDLEIFSKINQFKNLEYLDLDNIIFESNLKLNLSNLCELSLNYIKNIEFEKNSLLNLKKLILFKSEIKKDDNLLIKCHN